jgi:hypothetical protein
MNRDDTETNASPTQHTTLLSLVWTLGREEASEAQVVTRAASLVNTGRVVLTGNFAGARIELA